MKFSFILSDNKKTTTTTTLPLINSENIQTAYERWLNTNVISQKQSDYYGVSITLGAGDITSNQLRVLAESIREFSEEQKLELRLNKTFLYVILNPNLFQSFLLNYQVLGLAILVLILLFPQLDVLEQPLVILL